MLEVKAFTNWARTAGGTTRVAGLRQGADGKETVANLSDIKNPLARLVGTKDVGARRDAAVEAFRLALIGKYGGTIAKLAFEHGRMGCSSLKGLAASQVTSAVEMAERLSVQHKTLTKDGLLKSLQIGNTEEGTNVFHDHVLGPMSEKGREFVSKLLDATSSAHELLGTMPGGESELKALKTKCDSVISQLKARADSREAALFGSKNGVELKKMLQDLQNRLHAHLTEVKEFVGNAPGGEQAITEMAETWHEAMRNAARMRCNRGKEKLSDSDWNQAQKAMNEIDVLDVSFFVKTLKEKKTKAVAVFARKLNDIFAAHGVGKKILPGSGRREINAAYGDILNRSGWEPIVKSFDANVGGHPVELKSTIVSGRHIEPTLALGVMIDGEKFGGYEEKVNAYNSSSSETSNAVNLATTKIAVKDADGQIQTAFSGVRHAVNSAWDLTGATRSKASVARAVQCVHAALVSYLERNPNANPNDEVNLQMTSVSLLNPDFARQILNNFNSKHARINERRMMSDQYQAWQTLNRLKNPLELKVGNKTYKVKPDILMFNYGVNNFSTSKLSGLEMIGGWNAANELNSASWNGFIGRIADFKKTHPNDRETVRIVDTLRGQLERIRASGEAGRANHDAYKVGARLSVLSYLIGGVPCWNCKSGKDRTGQMDVECKFLAALIAKGQDIPEPGARLSAAQKELYRTISLEGGNLEIQKYNTGIGGSKVHDAKSVQERLGGTAETIAAFKGGAAYVHN